MANVLKVTSKKKSEFLTALRDMPNVSAACRLIGVANKTMYEHRKEDAEFAAAWDDAIKEGAENLEAIAMRRAMESHTSDTLMIFLLKGLFPEKYRENVKQEHSGDVIIRVLYDDH